jgi:hypothetical protein
MTGTEPNQGKENHHLIKENLCLAEKNRLATAIEALDIVVSELHIHRQIARNQNEREIANLNSKLDQAWLTEQHPCSLIDHLRAQSNGLNANTVQPKMHNGSVWGKIRPCFEDHHPGHENPRHQSGGEQGGEEQI